MFSHTNHIVAFHHEFFIGRKVLLKVVWQEVHLTYFLQGSEELVNRTWELRFEKWQPEHLGWSLLQGLTNFVYHIFVYNVLEVHCIKIIGPGMQNRKTVRPHVEIPEMLDIIFHKVECGLVGEHWVFKIVFFYLLLVIFEKVCYSLDTCLRLEVLRLY